MASTKTTRPLTTRDLLAIFGVTHMTLLNWRNPPEGVAHRKAPLPFTQKGRSITFSAIRVKAWATKHKIELLRDPVAVASGEAASVPAKPGPKVAPSKASVKLADAVFGKKKAAKKVTAAATKKRA